MAEIIPMLALSPTMEKGSIQKWLVKEGDAVSSGQAVCEVETDKTTMEYEVSLDGTLLKILAPEGQDVSVGMPIAIIGAPNEDIHTLLQKTTPTKPLTKEVSVPEQPPEIKAETPTPTDVSSDTHDIKASPLAKTLSREYSISLTTVHGTGPGGRIIKRDIEKAHSEQKSSSSGSVNSIVPSSETSDTTLPLTEKRRIIAQRLSHSKFTAPHYYLRASVAIDNLLASRNHYNTVHKDNPLSLNAFFIKLAAEAIRKNPVINTSWTDTGIQQHNTINIALAVAQPDGLITPVVKTCERKGVQQIDTELHQLIDKARHGSLLPEEYTGSTFTISNLGSYAIDEFTAIINPPEAAILALGRAIKTPVISETNDIVIRTVMHMTLSCDHRLIDGAKGAQFLTDLKNSIEEPLLALI